MNEQEINFLIRQTIEKAGFDPEFLNEATTVYTILHQSELEKINYTQVGLETLKSSVDAWKETSTGKRFLQQSTPTTSENNNQPGRVKEIVRKIQSGELKFQGY